MKIFCCKIDHGLDKIIKQQNEFSIEDLKCCGNCKNSTRLSRDERATCKKYRACDDKNKWCKKWEYKKDRSSD